MKTIKVKLLFTLCSLVIWSCSSQKKSKPIYPETKKAIKDYTFHNIQFKDNYSWLDNVQDESVKRWAKLQDSSFKNFTKSFRGYDLLKNKVSNLMNYSGKMELPMKVGDNYFYLVDNNEGVWNFYHRKANEQPKILKLPFNPRAIYFYIPSPNAKHLAIALAGPGGNFDWKTYDVENQKLSSETMRGSGMGKTRLSWTGDSKGFYYLSSNKIDEKGNRSELRIKYHSINTPYDNDRIVYTPNSDGSKLELKVSDDNKYLVVTERNGAASASKVGYFSMNGQSKIKPLIKEATSSYIFLGNNDKIFYFETDANTPKGKIVFVNVDEPENSWNDLIAEKDESIMGYQSAGGSLLPIIAGNKFVVPVQKNLNISLKIYDLRGNLERRIKLPSGGLYFNANGLNALSGNRENEEILTRFIGITEPNTIFIASIFSNEMSVFNRANVQFDANQFESKIVFCKSKDGTEVPISLTYKKGLKLNGKNPLMMQVYGAIAFTNYPYFQGDYISWLDMGGIHGVAHIRGGGALGSKWHQDGIARNKQNGIDDYIASLEWVIERGYTNSKKIVINGVSAGTIPVGGVLTQRPDLVGAVVSHYGMLDMVGYAEKFKENPSHAYMIPEIGQTSNEEDFKVLNKYSPYLKLNNKIKYPPVLALTSDIDAPLNSDSYKFIAKLQENSNNYSPMLLQMAWGSQHSGFGSQSHSPIDTFTDEMAFLIKALDLKTDRWLIIKE